jgi:hypothetical protein
MRQPQPGFPTLLSRLALTLALLALWSCGSAPPVKKEPEPVAPPAAKTEPVTSERATLTLPPSAYSEQFSRANSLLASTQWMAATEILQQIPTTGLNANDNAYRGYLQARMDFMRGEQNQALNLLTGLDRPGVDIALRYRILNFQRYILDISGSYLESARLGDQLLGFAPTGDIPALKRSVWRDLQKLDSAQLEQAMAEAVDPQWQDWLALALLTRAPLNETLQQLPAWLQENPLHPAATPLPGGLSFLLAPPARPDKVALILPLSDRLAAAGRAVRDGYMASYYDYMASHGGSAAFEVLVLDEDTFPSASAAYDAALAQGATIVVGPLSKQAVAELAARTPLPIPVLALNRLEDTPPAVNGGSALVQLSLAPEDEAVTAADLAFGQGARSALIIRPESDWGSKVAQALVDQWQQLGGTVANSVTYLNREDYSATVKAALDIPASEQRARDLRGIMGGDVEYSARRRQDIDVIFLLSGNAAEARSLKPLLAFHYAGTVPVYAISGIYSGVPDPRDRDLDGINLVEMPWLLGANPELEQAIAAGRGNGASYTRLNALGADAFLLQTQFRRLQAGPDALLRGNTGLLSMNPQLQIQRELVLSTFDEGAVQPR